MTLSIRCALPEVSGDPSEFCTDTVVVDPCVTSATRYFSGAELVFDEPNSELRKPGSALSVTGST